MNKQNNINEAMSVIAASYLGPALTPNQEEVWSEAQLPVNTDDLVQKVMGKPMRRAGRFIKMVCCGALTCLQGVPSEDLKEKKIGIFLATGLGNVDEILPFITQVFKHDGGFPSPNQFANSVSNAAAFFLARICDIKGVVLTVSQEELSFESALWLAQSYLTAQEIDLALVGGCDVFTPTVEDYRQRMDLKPGNYRPASLGEGSSWILLGENDGKSIGRITEAKIGFPAIKPEHLSVSDSILSECEKIAAGIDGNLYKQKVFLPGFRLQQIDSFVWEKNGWRVEDYLPHCGIHPTAVAYGLARELISRPQVFLVHYNHDATGRKALIAAITK
jgi:hypothetical protein